MQQAPLQSKRFRITLLLATTLVALVTLAVTFRNAHESSPGGHVAGEATISDTNAASHITARKPTSLTVDSLSPELSILPGSISRALSNSWKLPTGIPERDVLSAREKDILQLLLAQGSPSNRVAHLSILEAVGGDSSATALIHMLTDEFSGGVLSIRDYYSMVDAVYSLGCISTRSARAKGFLEQAISEDFWAQKRKWFIAPQNHFEDTDMNFWLARESLKALAVGGHEEVLILAQQVRESPFQTQKKWAGTVVDTIFLFDRSKLRSGPFLPEDGEKLAPAFEQWGETERGRYWRDWSQSIRETATPPGK